jgi:hypothetical protein
MDGARLVGARTSVCGNAPPTKVYGDDRICSCVEVTRTLPSGSINRLHEGEDRTAGPGEASMTPPVRQSSARKFRQVLYSQRVLMNT